MSDTNVSRSPLDELCKLYGIAAEYKDIWGRVHPASAETRLALLRALGVIENESDIEQAIKEHERQTWTEVVPPVAVFRIEGNPYRMRFRFSERQFETTYRWTFALDNGDVRTGEFRPCDLERLRRHELDGKGYIEVAFDWRDRLPCGYHRYALSGPDIPFDAYVSFIVGPERCYVPPQIEGGGRTWGAALQLYALRSERNWGVGDFTDLRASVELWGQRGAGVVGVNPLHALFPHNPAHSSPYSPSSRLFLNVIYIDVEAVPDAAECAEVLATIASPQFQKALAAARASALVDYPAVSALKLPLLERLYRHFREHHLAAETDRGRDFRVFQQEGGRRLRQHALFEALQAHFHRSDPSMWGWPVWPEAYRRPQAPEVARFAEARENAERIELYEYLQWQAALQLRRAARRAKDLDFAVGIYQDLAISIDRGGAESWANQDVYAVGASVGAPPDEVNLKGQNWGLPPLRPNQLRAARYGPYIATLRANMRYASALRIDHVMGLYRLYWIPLDAPAADGAYVHYAFDDLLTILALESARNECMVIGEDLGTVPDEVRAGLDRTRVFSYRVLYFERDAEGTYRKPQEYPANALVAVSTHDLATLAGFWEGHDLEVRRELDLFPSEEVRTQYVANRGEERVRLGAALEREKLLPKGATTDAGVISPELARAIHAYLAKTPSRVFVVQLEDVLGEREQANLPGTVEEQPNWRRKIPITLEALERDPRFVALTEALARVRPRPGPARTRRPPARARIPRCTYRLQLNASFTLDDATALVPYLARLGVSHIYCSPYLRARAGSTHGYDIIDHNALNPEIGSREAFERFVAALKDNGMGHVLDMVPNHMGVMGVDNAWWLDVLENGRASAYADFFDIEWTPVTGVPPGKVLLPVLGDHYGVVLERGELALTFSRDAGEFAAAYFGHRFPIDPRTYPRILEIAIAQLRASDLPQRAASELASLCAAFGHLPARDAAGEQRLERQRDKDIHKRQLARVAAEHALIAEAIGHAVAVLNGTPANRASFERLHELLEDQAYRLASWRVAVDEINFRRFFDINDLAALRMENEAVFEATHRFVLALAAEGKIDGLRIDHPDGLYDPDEYFRRLQARYAQLAGIETEPENGRPARPLYVVVEKIAASHEKLPESWAVYGTSGYRFATVVNNVLVDCTVADEMERIYRGFAEDAHAYAQSAYEGKRTIMQAALAAPLMMLASELLHIARADRRTRDYTLFNLRHALSEIVACFPVYRTYIVDTPSAQDRRYIDWAVAQARRRSSAADTSIFEFVRHMLLAEAPADTEPELAARVRTFARKVQQFTAPVTAKGIEDTAFYRYNRLVSLNDVGGDPDQFGMPVSAFHGATADRAAHRPHTMLATSTHDNKRSEDVRARIDVISEMPSEWRQLLRRWARMNRSKKTPVDNEPAAPSANDEYLLYQVLLGSFPPHGMNADALASYTERIERYMLKAVREAKLHTSWVSANEHYETAVTAFVRALLAPGGRNLFLKDLGIHGRRIAWYGMLNTLSMTLLKLASPGVPDIYQGNESCDLSLVDPDNRRPVDYGARERVLNELIALANSPELARQARRLALAALDGRAKTWVVWRTLALRREHAQLFELGHYLPLHAEGARAEHVIAFMRRHGADTLIVIAGRLWLKLGSSEGELPDAAMWDDTRIEAGPLSGPLTNVFTGETVEIENGRIRVAHAFASFPAALLISRAGASS